MMRASLCIAVLPLFRSLLRKVALSLLRGSSRNDVLSLLRMSLCIEPAPARLSVAPVRFLAVGVSLSTVFSAASGVL